MRTSTSERVDVPPPTDGPPRCPGRRTLDPSTTHPRDTEMTAVDPHAPAGATRTETDSMGPVECRIRARRSAVPDQPTSTAPAGVRWT